MTRLDKTARLAPSTITGVSTGRVPTAAPTRPRRASVAPIPTAYAPAPQRTYTRVHPDVWYIAMVQAEGDALLIEVLGATEVIVHNSRDWRKRR